MKQCCHCIFAHDDTNSNEAMHSPPSLVKLLLSGELTECRAHILLRSAPEAHQRRDKLSKNNMHSLCPGLPSPILSVLLFPLIDPLSC